ncbi:Uncharacterised protein [Mycobacteroides abscessus subsp. abscessus]|nr:Uncharacterised protein [Mycobacteroides abscessus subsp. abscessus]
METDPRPSIVTVPSASTVAQSPGIAYRTPLNVLNVSAVFFSSLKYPTGMWPLLAISPRTPEPG